MTEAEFDDLIRYHEFQAKLWGPETVAHKDHGKWAAELHALKEGVLAEISRRKTQADEEEFRDDLERRHRDDPAWWRWWGRQRTAPLAAEKRIEGHDEQT